uniref:Uncharacterized protein n=1 Tax=Anguilla anguilla TaxID=7936 RepID=A0A0E9Q5R6_ANGAN
MHFGKRVQTSHSPSNGTAEKITNSNTLHSRGVNMKLILTRDNTEIARMLYSTFMHLSRNIWHSWCIKSNPLHCSQTEK